MSRAEVAEPTVRRAVRWMLWLAGGISFGLLAGFLAALSQPREQFRPPEPDSVRNAGAGDGS